MLWTGYLFNVRLFENEFEECAVLKHREVRKLVVGDDLGLNLHQFVQRDGSMQYHTVQVFVNRRHHQSCTHRQHTQCMQSDVCTG